MNGLRTRTAGLAALVAVTGVAGAAVSDAGGKAGASGSIAVTVVTKKGKTDKKAGGYEICATPKAWEGATGTKDCATVKKGKATIKSLAAHGWYLQTVGGTGLGPCYSKHGNGKTPASCTKVPVKAGKTTKLNWRVPKPPGTP